MDGPGIAGGLRAGACDLPYGLIPDLGTDLPKVNPETYRKARIQEGGRPLLEVPAIKPDVAVPCTASRPMKKATCSISARITSTC